MTSCRNWEKGEEEINSNKSSSSVNLCFCSTFSFFNTFPVSSRFNPNPFQYLLLVHVFSFYVIAKQKLDSYVKMNKEYTNHNLIFSQQFAFLFFLQTLLVRPSLCVCLPLPSLSLCLSLFIYIHAQTHIHEIYENFLNFFRLVV